MSLHVLGVLAASIGTVMEKTAKSILPPIFGCLNDQKKVVVNGVIDCVTVWVEEAEVPFSVFLPFLSEPITKAPTARKLLITWLMKYLADLDGSVSLSCLVPSVVECLQDRNQDVRHMSENFCQLVMQRVGLPAVEKEVQTKCNKATQRNMIPLLQKLHQETKQAVKPSVTRSVLVSPQKKQENLGSTRTTPQKGPTTPQKGTTTPQKESLRSSAQRRGVRSKSEISPANDTGKDTTINLGPNPLLKNPGKRNRRAIKHKRLDWRTILETSSVTEEFLTSTSIELLACVGSGLHYSMVSTDHRHHIQAIDGLLSFLVPECQFPTEFLESFDIFLKWISLRLILYPGSEEESPLLSKLVNFLISLLQFLVSQDTFLSEAEGNLIIPVVLHCSPLINSVPSSSSSNLRTILSLLSQVFPMSRIIDQIIASLANPINSSDIVDRVTFLLDEISFFLNRNGAPIFKINQGALPIANIALKRSFKSLTDPKVLESARKVVNEVINCFSDEFWEYVSEEDRDQLESLSSDSPPKSSSSSSSGNRSSVSVSKITEWVKQIEDPSISEEALIALLKRCSNGMSEDEGAFSISADRLVLSLESHLTTHLQLGKGGSPRCAKYLITCLYHLFERSHVAKLVAQNTLEHITKTVLEFMSEAHRSTKEGTLSSEGEYLLKACNMVITKELENANRTAILSVLLQLLRQSATDPDSAFTDFVMKCLLKVTKELKSSIDEVNLKHILREIHLFLSTFPPEEWEGKPNKTPLKTVKALLLEIVQIKETGVLRLLSLVPSHPVPAIVNYIQLMLKKDDSPPPSSSSSSDGKQQQHKYQMTPELVSIIKRCGQKETTGEGIAELYNYKRRKEIDDIAPLLAKVSANFRTYILRNLEAKERKERENERNLEKDAKNQQKESDQKKREQMEREREEEERVNQQREKQQREKEQREKEQREKEQKEREQRESKQRESEKREKERQEQDENISNETRSSLSLVEIQERLAIILKGEERKEKRNPFCPTPINPTIEKPTPTTPSVSLLRERLSLVKREMEEVRQLEMDLEKCSPLPDLSLSPSEISSLTLSSFALGPVVPSSASVGELKESLMAIKRKRAVV